MQVKQKNETTVISKVIVGFPRIERVLLRAQISVIGLRRPMATGYEANDQPLSQGSLSQCDGSHDLSNVKVSC